MVLGSVAEKVVRSAGSPVLVVHRSDRVGAGELNIKKILIPADGSENTRPAIAQGFALAGVFGAEVTVLCVADPAIMSPSKTPEGSGQSSRVACLKATEFVEREGQRLGVAVQSIILTGIPSEEIVRASADYDLIVMGNVGRTGLAHILLGSVAESTVRQARCPVLVVRAKDGKKPE